MARLGRSFPVPVLVKDQIVYRLVDVGLDPFESISEWPSASVVTPDVNFNGDPFESISEWPDLAVDRDQVFSLDAFESISEWPAFSVSVPIKPGDSMTGADGEVEWNGVLWGPSTGIRVMLPVEGWLGSPQIDNLNVLRPSRHGAWDARKLAQQRIVSIRLQPNSASDPTQVQDLIDQVLAATGIPDSEDPLPLVIKGYGAPKLAYGQVVDRPLVMDDAYNVGLPTIGVLIACGDPRLYGLDPRGATVPLNTPTGLSNAGNASTHPFIRMPGPVINPVLVNATLGRTLEFSLTVADGHILEIDTDNGTVTVDGVSKMSALTGSSVPVQDFVLQAGTTTIEYTADSGGGDGVDLLWRDATL